MDKELNKVLESILATAATNVTMAKQLRELTRHVARVSVRSAGDAENGAKCAVALADAEAAVEEVQEIAGATLKALSTLSYGDRQYLEPIGRTESSLPSDFQISSAIVERRGGHDVVRIWNRGSYAGELVVSRDDGMWIANRLSLLLANDPIEPA